MAVTLKDVARLAGTSQASASAVLNKGGGKNTRVGAETRDKIVAAAAQLGYVVNPIARSLVTGRTGVLGLMLPYDSSFLYPDPWGATVVNGLVAEAVRRKYNLMLYTSVHGHWQDDAAAAVDLRVDGIVVVMPLGNEALFEHCARLSIPVVSILRVPKHENELVVNSNDIEGGRLATQHLIDLGHRRIALMKGWDEVPTTAGRVQGYLDCLTENGIAYNPDLLIQSDFNRAPGKESVTQLIESGIEMPTAIVCCNDLCAHGVIDGLQAAGLSVPGDVSVVGYDDTWYAGMITPQLTTVNMASEELGVNAASLLISLIERKPIEDKHPVLPVSLTVRDSTGPVRKK